MLPLEACKSSAAPIIGGAQINDKVKAPKRTGHQDGGGDERFPSTFGPRVHQMLVPLGRQKWRDHDDFVGALDCGGNKNDARKCSGAGDFRSGAARACGVSDKMPRWRHEM
jgi:hypothetical protein